MMKTTIVRLLCFNRVWLLSFILLLVACGPAIHLTNELEIVHSENTHSRALDIQFTENGTFAVIAGSKGRYSFLDTKSLNITLQDSIPQLEDIRDVEILQNGDVLFLNSGNTGVIWKYIHDKDSIIEVFYEDSVFLDGFSFWDNRNGIAYGDPVDNNFVVLVTQDGGNKWNQIPTDFLPDILKKEAGFAASGTGIVAVGDSTAYIASGISETARMFRTFDRGKSWDVVNTPIKSGDSYGIYSTYFWSENEGMIIGGSYLYPNDNDSICYRTKDAGLNWTKTDSGLGGYCSCIDGSPNGDLLIATGRTGTYYSVNKGEKWGKLFDEKYYTVKIYENRLYFSGKNGSFAVYSFEIQ